MIVLLEYVALKLKYPVDINDYRSFMHVSLYMSLQVLPPRDGQVSTDEQQTGREYQG